MSITDTVTGLSPYTTIPQLNNTLTTAAEQTQAVSSVEGDSSGVANDSGSQNEALSSFEAVLSKLLPGTGGSGDKVNEEQLFSALLEERLTTLKGSELAATYSQYFEENKSQMTTADGYVPVETAAREALRSLVADGSLTTEEAEEIHAQAFQAAQIDDNKGALYDSFGTTMAVTLVEMAMRSSSAMMASFDSGELEAGRLSLDFLQESGPAQFNSANSISASNESAEFVGGDGFLFKPVSEKNGNLVVLLPATMSGQIKDVSLVDNSGQTIETGDAFEDFEDGRPVFRFDQAGGSYPSNITVTVTMLDGSEKQYNIANPGQRYA